MPTGMPTATAEQQIHTLEVLKDESIDAPVQAVFDAVLDELGPEAQTPDGHPLSMKIEPWPGGRWFRDLGNGAGHLWGHVQVIKPPTLVELCGPMFMSYPVVNHVQYRLTPEGAGTRLKLTHKAFGLISREHRDTVQDGWSRHLRNIRSHAARRHAGGAG